MAGAKGHEGDPEKGKRIFRLCAGCHSLKPGEIRVGPSFGAALYCPEVRGIGLVDLVVDPLNVVTH